MKFMKFYDFFDRKLIFLNENSIFATFAVDYYLISIKKFLIS